MVPMAADVLQTVADYSTRDVARVLTMQQAQIRGFVRDGFVQPERGERGELRFSFSDVVLLRAARDLAAALPARRVHRALRRLRDRLATAEDISRVQIVAEGNQVLVRDGEGTWNAESGQEVLDFSTPEPAGEVATLHIARPSVTLEGSPSIDELFELALDLEAASHEQTEAAYARVLQVDPTHVDANINMGRLMHEQGKLREATTYYGRALEHRPGDATALFNLGVVLEDLDDATNALAAYEKAIAGDPSCAEAYYNAAQLYEQRGEGAAAIRCLARYRELTKHER